MLETLLLPGGYSPMVDCLGRLTAYSRDVTRASDIVLTDEQLIRVTGGKSSVACTRLFLKWLDPNLTRVDQQDRVLYSTNITAGFFQLRQAQEVWFSDDHTQRARDTRLVIVQSANSGLLSFCDEEYELIGAGGGEGDLHGRIVVTTSAWAPALATLALGNMLNAATIPDGVVAFGGGYTIPIGRLIHAAAEAVILLVMMSIGTGRYEVWGVPYDYVHGRNTSEFYDEDAEPGVEKAVTIESDFVLNEDHAKAFGGREFLFAALGANTYSFDMVDDLRVQVGTIVEHASGVRVFVLGYTRDLRHGAAAVLQVSGFRVPGVA
jgi:hypothetical protein